MGRSSPTFVPATMLCPNAAQWRRAALGRQPAVTTKYNETSLSLGARQPGPHVAVRAASTLRWHV